MKIQFLGAAGEVTGSRHSVEVMLSGRTRHFMVDYGMFQGGREATNKNLEALPFSPKDLDFIVLTHAHIDHSGLLPRLCAQGFKGPIYCTGATLELLKILLPDSAYLQRADVDRAERKKKAGKWRGEMPIALYSREEVEMTLTQFEVLEYGQTKTLAPGIELEFRNAGHILGSAIAVIDITEDAKQKKRCVFSGDIGMKGKVLMPDPDLITSADVLVVESTYGDRLHRNLQATEDELVEVVNSTLSGHGNIVMPAFAVGRTQEILFLLIDLVKRKRLPHLNIWVDSPMATAATHLTQRFFSQMDNLSQDTFKWYQNHPNAVDLRFIADVEESKALNKIKGGAIIVSASGMCDAGRIVHHLASNLPRAQNAIIITGFQAYGSLGRRLVDKAQKVRLFGEEVPVKASIHTIGGLSAHADQAGLLDWLTGFDSIPKSIFVVHGEPESSSVFAESIRENLEWKNVIIPERLHTYEC
ncbi:putative exonuclease of the beta-lactamase fold involved in RNA processing [Polynucleobacter duraquae]|uniref:Exonuclease of the beta-lactamase fold involved in RNA processing n=1 Tax=Polynucleobacter duraquae TaxID=1835254 RepID=A0A0E3ZLX7_9BURK|nr:MBL fold metallo-hydrolase [Polynucleobacter duraquae]AKD25181.1 putative exonuclease of the beta-lactamase fold involved in RNA processing [Polynucleobacter duraquae]